MKKFLSFLLIILLSCFFTSCSFNKKAIVYITTSDRQYDLKKLELNIDNSSHHDNAIIIDPSITYQEIDGFGAALTGSSCYNLSQMDKNEKFKFLEETFSPEKGYGTSYIRVSIGCSDFSLDEYTCCDEPGIENFHLTSEEIKDVIPILKEILAINPNIKILASPWTCPKWMKVNNLIELKPYDSWTGGQLNPSYYLDYANYFVKWIKAFQNYNIPIYSITIQNEPLNRGNSASLFMGWEEQRDFIKTALGPTLKKSNLNTKIYVFDHNYNYDQMEDQFQYPLHIYKDEEASAYITGAAYHNYGGHKEELLNIHKQAPEKELVFTESSIGTWNDGRNIEKRLIADMNELGLGTLNNWCKAVIVWNLMLDTDLGPNRPKGCRTCYGAVDIDINDYSTIIRNSHYYMFTHLSAVVKPNAIRIESKDINDKDLTYCAFKNTDGSFAFVITNNAEKEKSITIQSKKKAISYSLPPKSIVSFLWDE